MEAGRTFERGPAHTSPFDDLFAHLRDHGPPDVAAIEQLASTLNRSPARVRGVLSFYNDLREPGDSLRVCRGTSCELARSNEPATQSASGPACRSVYCLGYCDRSPALLRGECEILLGAGARHAACDAVGHVDTQPPRSDIRCLAREPVVTRRLLAGDFASLDAARANGAYEALTRALRHPPAEVIDVVVSSGERGRGGAGFSTGVKWRSCAQAPAQRRYVIANGDEGDPGSFIDRELMERDPHGVLEGLMLCAYAVGASQAIVFVRSEYPWAIDCMQRAIRELRDAGCLGRAIFGSDFDLDVSLVRGLGSYVCGEETAMIRAIEGLRGEVQIRPPYPTERGLFGFPTVVNNVETLVNVPWIVERGAEAFRALGTPRSAGTKAICLNHGFGRPGIVEVEFGTPLERVIEHAGGGASGTSIEALAIGGPMGSIVECGRWEVAVCYDAMQESGIQLGHGGILALLEGTDYGALARHWLTFMAHESCGRCVPCALGSKSALALARRADDRDASARLDVLLEAIETTSLCAFGQLLPRPVRELLELDRTRARRARTSP